MQDHSGIEFHMHGLAILVWYWQQQVGQYSHQMTSMTSFSHSTTGRDYSYVALV